MKIATFNFGSIGVMGRRAFRFFGSEFRVVKSNLVVLLGIPPELFFNVGLKLQGRKLELRKTGALKTLKCVLEFAFSFFFSFFCVFPHEVVSQPPRCVGGAVATEEAGWIPGQIGIRLPPKQKDEARKK